MKFSVVTPCLNPGRLLPETVETVLGQKAVTSGRVELEYLIVDGGSTDGTVEYLKSIDDQRLSWISESDKGMYDALAKGLRQLTGDVHSYLNAGDLYHPHAFDVVADLRDHEWVTGMDVTYNDRGDVIAARTPFAYRTDWLRKGLYDGTVLQFLQQESTFWSSRLTTCLDLDRLASFRLAGDAYLWATLSRFADLTVVGAHLGGFRLHAQQLSDDLDAYRAEMRVFTDRPSLGDRIMARGYRMIDRHTPVGWKRRLSRGRLLLWRDDQWI